MKLYQTNRRRRGTEVIEVALLLPIMLVLIFGMIQASFYFYLKHVSEGAAREGVRNGVIAGNTAASAEAAIRAAMGTLPVNNIQWPLGTPENVAAGSPLAVVVSTNTSNFKLPFWQLINTPTIDGQATMQKEP